MEKNANGYAAQDNEELSSAKLYSVTAVVLGV